MNYITRPYLSVLIIFLASVPLLIRAQENRSGNHCGVSKSPYRLSMDSGKAVYLNNCQYCHQPDGMGVLNRYPPLNGQAITGDKSKLIEILIVSHTSLAEQKGNEASYIMPPNPAMKDQEIADVLTYIRNSFGNRASSVKPSEVKAERNKTKKAE